ncbi:MAG: sulfatase-like hydrolase/transferase [Cyclobacteriaceae bacterium]
MNCLFLSLSLLSCGTETNSETDNQAALKPNIIILYADDLGYGDLSSYGGDIPTPNIDQIGKDGIRFTQFYVSSPACSPSRYSLLTGSYPQRSMHGLDKVIMPGNDFHIDDEEVLLPELLKTQGYFTGIMGKWHLGSHKPEYLPTHYGFDRFSGMQGGVVDHFTHVYGAMGHDWFVDGKPQHDAGYSTELITRYALGFLDEASAKENPFFLYIPYTAPHYGKTDPDTIPDVTVALSEGTYQGYEIMNTLQAPPEYVDQFSQVEDPYRRVYSAMVACLDDNIGKVMATLEEKGMSDNTMVWFISDNGGYSIRYHGHSSNGILSGEKGATGEGGIRIPAMVQWKGKIEPAQVITQPIGNVDLVPTLGAITGYADTLSSLPIDGIDINEVLFEGKTLERDLFWRYHGDEAFRRGDWKLRNGEALYNLASDMSEQNNLAAEYPDKVNELQQEVEKLDRSFDAP